MTRFLIPFVFLFFSINVFSQNTNLSDYSFIVVPDQFDFLQDSNRYKLNSMSKFYFEKSGFNAYLTNDTPNANRCDGLYANVEELKSFLGTKLQVVIKDCNDREIYRSTEGKSKYKEFVKSYQDALRKAFSSIEALGVKQKDVVLLSEATTTPTSSNNTEITKKANSGNIKDSSDSRIKNTSGAMLPTSKFSNYSLSGKTYLLRKTAEGYSLYEESAASQDGLLLKGKVVVLDQVLKYMDTSGNVSDASFDGSGNLTVKNVSATMVFKSEN